MLPVARHPVVAHHVVQVVAILLRAIVQNESNRLGDRWLVPKGAKLVLRLKAMAFILEVTPQGYGGYFKEAFAAWRRSSPGVPQ